MKKKNKGKIGTASLVQRNISPEEYKAYERQRREQGLYHFRKLQTCRTLEGALIHYIQGTAYWQDFTDAEYAAAHMRLAELRRSERQPPPEGLTD